MKYRFLSLIALFLTIHLTSCDFLEKQESSVVSNSTGGFDEILVVADKAALNDYLQKPLKELMTQGYEVLPQYEPRFLPMIIGYDDFDRTFRRYRTIVMIADLSAPTSLAEFVTESLGENNTIKALNDDSFYYAVKKNVWAEPQLLIFVFAPDQQMLLKKIAGGMPEVLNLISRNELDKYRNNVFFNGVNEDLTQKLKTKYGLELPIPESFVLALEVDDFLWIRDVSPESSDNIMVSIRPMQSDSMPDVIDWRNELGHYISGKTEGSYMLCDTLIPPIRSEKNVDDHLVLETRGLWKMEGDFMGGPYLNYVFADSKNNRWVMLDGFVHAPGEKKKPEIRKLEAVFSGLGKTRH